MVFKSMHAEAYRWACSCCRYDEDQAKEVLQQVYLEILSNKAVFRGESSLRTWLFSVIRRAASGHRRRNFYHNLLKNKLSLLAEPEPGSDETLKAHGKDAVNREVLTALKRLPLMQRQIVELVYYRDFSLNDAALILGIKTGTARTHFHRAKQTLAGLLRHIRN